MNEKFNLKFNLFDTVYYISFYAVFFCILFLRWYANLSPDKFIAIFTAFLILILFSNKNIFFREKFNFKFCELLILILFVIYIFFNIFLFPNGLYIVSYLLNFTIIPFFALLFVSLSSMIKKDNFYKYILLPFFWIINIYNFINFFVILKQIDTPGFLVRNFSENTFFKDMINGFVGYNGSSKLSFIYLICLFISYLFFNNKNRLISKFSKFFFCFTLFTSLYVSLFNDNRFYYFLLFLFFLPFLKRFFDENFSNLKKIPKKTFKIFLIVFMFILSFFLIYHFNSSFKIVVDDIFYKNFTRTYNNIIRSSKNVYGGEQRIELLRYIFDEDFNIFLGNGIGSIPVIGEGDNLPRNFGLNDINVRIYSGGLIFYFGLLFLYFVFILRMFSEKSFFIKIYLFFMLIFLSFYTHVFAYGDKVFLIMFTFYFLSLNLNKKELG